MLLAAASLPGRVEAATVEHGLRAESAAEALGVAGLCERLRVPHAVLPVHVAPGNLQAEARAARYAALTAWADARRLDAITTAHHADDQAETLLMRLNRGSGLAGLAGVRASRALPCKTLLVRPLLGWRRAELSAVCTAAGVATVSDPANTDPRFDRTQMRDVLGTAPWIDVAALARSAGLLAEAHAALTELAQAAAERQVRYGATEAELRAEGPRALLVEIILCIGSKLGYPLSRSQAGVMHDRLCRGDNASAGGLLAQVTGRSENGVALWHFAPEPARRTL